MNTIALFGESQRGEFQKAYYCKNLSQLSDLLGEPPNSESQGLKLAIQSLMYDRGIVFFRVDEEGFSINDYLSGFHFLENKELFPSISALCLPGVGNTQIIDATTSICAIHNSILMITERDLYDYLTCC